jgi:CRP-like cAMP-binding protein
MEQGDPAASRLGWVKSATVFKGLGEKELADIAHAASLQTRSDGEFFFMQGDAALRSYLLVEGQVRLSQVSQDGQQVLLGYIGAGREFGIISGLKTARYPVSAQAVSPSRALAWDHKLFQHMFETMPIVQYNAMQIMARQIGEFQSRIRELSTQRVERRIARALLRLARRSGKQTNEGVLIDLPLTRQDLAELSGTTLFTVKLDDETMGDPVAHQEQARYVTILDPHGLVSLAEDFLTTNRLLQTPKCRLFPVASIEMIRAH